jgi:hypothetical protein
MKLRYFKDNDPINKSTRFANGTKHMDTSSSSSKKPAIVARDHSLGREYLNPDDKMSVEGFSWQDPVLGNSHIERISSHGSIGYGPPPPTFAAGMPPSRIGSYSSVGYGPPSMGPPLPPGGGPYDHSMSPQPQPPGPPPPQDLHERYASWNRYESWGSVGQPHPHPPPQSPMGYGPYPTQSAGWAARDHSLGAIPLQHANISQAAYPATFDHRMGSSGPFWGPHPSHRQSYPPPSMEAGPPPSHRQSYPPPPSMEAGPPQYHYSGGYPPPYSGEPRPSQSKGPPQYAHPPSEAAASHHTHYHIRPAQPPVSPKSPTYTVDPNVASQWSGRDHREIVLTLSGSSCDEKRDSFASHPVPTSFRNDSSSAPTTQMKPDLIKRATSNQNETFDSKPDFDGKCVKRAALNRDSSLAANALKVKYMPGYFDPRTEVELLSSNLEQSTLAPSLPPKPVQYTNQDRKMTLDMAALDLVIRPTMLRMTSRSTTIEALNIDFDDDNFDPNRSDPYTVSSPAITEFDRDLSSMDDIFNESRTFGGDISRPSTLRASQRLTTSDLIDIGMFLSLLLRLNYTTSIRHLTPSFSYHDTVNEPLSDNDD